ncbi:MAG: hypothetical protein Tsb0018_07460 [Opitutales bacterium]|tara:strand:+ start:3057 stop:3344 length:288 start_codon:yes stop_codon:yes gene_type:complete
MNETLSQADKKKLRGIAQRMKPTVSVGKQGLTETLLQEMERAFDRDGLVKVRFNVSREPMHALCEEIVNRLHCERTGHVGKTASFYRTPKEAKSK